jgi:hypothetical protein
MKSVREERAKSQGSNPKEERGTSKPVWASVSPFINCGLITGPIS